MAKAPAKKPKLNYVKGALYAIGGPIVGIVLWIIIWEMGFIASIATFAMAWLTVWLYKKGAGGIDRPSLYIILFYIVIGIVLSILSGMAADMLDYLVAEADEVQGMSKWDILQTEGYWAMLWDNLAHNSALWKEYTSSIIFAVGLGALGVFGTVRDVILGTVAVAEKPNK